MATNELIQHKERITVIKKNNKRVPYIQKEKRQWLVLSYAYAQNKREINFIPSCISKFLYRFWQTNF